MREGEKKCLQSLSGAATKACLCTVRCVYIGSPGVCRGEEEVGVWVDVEQRLSPACSCGALACVRDSREGRGRLPLLFQGSLGRFWFLHYIFLILFAPYRHFYLFIFLLLYFFLLSIFTLLLSCFGFFPARRS